MAVVTSPFHIRYSSITSSSSFKSFRARMDFRTKSTGVDDGFSSVSSHFKTIDSHLHVWASPAEAADKYPYHPGQEPTLDASVGFLLQVYLKFSALFCLSRKPFPYDLSTLLFEVISSYGSNRIMWGSDFPFVVPECGYKGAKESAIYLANEIQLSLLMWSG